jgi:hypothetical protein
MVVGFSGFLGIVNNTYSELMTLFIGLKLANNMGCNQVCCYRDSKTIINIVTKSVNKYHVMLLSLLVFVIENELRGAVMSLSHIREC